MTDEKFSGGVRNAPSGAPTAVGRGTVSDAEVATEDEVREQLLALDDEALARLEIRAASYRRMLPEDGGDLVNEAIQRALVGCRKWPKAVPFIAFMFQTMRSIASEWLKRNRREVAESRLAHDGDEDDGEMVILERERATWGDPEDVTRLRELADGIEETFKGDDDVMAIIIGRVEGLTEAETRERFDLTPQAFAAAQKRLRRAVLAGKVEGWL